MVGDVMPTNSVIDLSHHNGTRLRFNKAKTDGIVGVIQKATQGEVYIDPTFKKNRTAVLEAELLFGAYHFGTGSADAYRTPVPPQRWHLTTLSPFFSRPLPSQFLHFCFFLMLGPFALAMMISRRRGSRLNVSPEADVPGRRDAIAVDSMHRPGACHHSPAHGLAKSSY
jgi:hypothetical protein